MEIIESDLTRKQLLDNSAFDAATKEKINTADILLVPEFEFRGEAVRFFPEGSSDFLKLLRQEMPNLSVVLCENSGNEKSLGLHSGDIYIPVLMVSIDPFKDVILPTLINFITSYAFSKLGTTTNSKVHLTICVEDKKSRVTKRIRYDGPASGLKDLNVDSRGLFKK